MHLVVDLQAAWSNAWQAKSFIDCCGEHGQVAHAFGGPIEIDRATLSVVIYGTEEADHHYETARVLLVEQFSRKEHRFLFELARRAAVHFAAKRYHEAAWLYRKSADLSQRVLGESHENTKTARRYLQLSLEAQRPNPTNAR